MDVHKDCLFSTQLLRRFNRNIVQDTSIHQEHIVHPHRLKHNREGHCGSESFIEFTFLENHLFSRYQVDCIAGILYRQVFYADVPHCCFKMLL